MNKNDLISIYGVPKGRAAKKVLPSLEKHSKHFISKSPFMVISTFDKNGNVDTSPRGGRPGFVHILNDNQILIPDAKGNNRVDSLRNIADTARIGALFLLPGIDETLRINGHAKLVTDEKYLSIFANESHPPKTCILIDIKEVFLHCAKALMRSQLWNPDKFIAREDFPTMGRMLKDQLGGDKPIETHKEMVERYLPDL